MRSLIDDPRVDQARTIARATFDGFLQSDLVPPGMQAPALIWAAAFLVGPALFLPAQFLAKYSVIRKFHPEMLERALWGDRVLFLMMSAGAVGIVSVVLWETLFPARRDAFVLTPLPVSLRVQMTGRLGGLLALCVGFLLALNLVPAFTVSVTTSGAFLEMPRVTIAHFVATGLADMFVFFSVTSLQGLVILAFGRRTAARLSPVAQMTAVLGVLLSILFMTGIGNVTIDALLRSRADDPALTRNPAAWFLGLYEVLAGTPRPIMTSLALRAVAAAAVPTAITFGVYAFGYQRLLKRAVETPSRSSRSWLGRAGSRVIRTLVIRRPQEQAIAGFVLRAIARSGRHSMMMAIYLGAGLALVVTVMLTEFIRLGQGALSSPMTAGSSGPTPTAILVSPLIISAALACGIRILMTLPADMPARWVFQTAAITPRDAAAGAHKTLLLLVVPPVVLCAALSAGVLWGAANGAAHGTYCGALAILLCEVLLITFKGLPLTRPYIPGASRFHMLWAFYLTAFLTYTYSSIGLELDLFLWAGPSGVVRGAAVFAGLALVVWIWRWIKLREISEVPFETELQDDETFRGFNLSEIHAAQAVAARGSDARPR